ncbi:unnamed protein product [Prorocentrum cordatum]|uniref:Uncharacterized protein n=1 Tax=Prorocentrum cordatum TaxID=2364126 RepID=A0ABN9S1D4_9DINO|nr:unnamed protein product [Polarella glacialis]
MAAGAQGEPGRRPPEGRPEAQRSPAAEVLLAKFEELYAAHQSLSKTSDQLARVQAENEELRVRIRHLTAHDELRGRTSQDSSDGRLRIAPKTDAELTPHPCVELTPRPKQEVAPPVPSLGGGQGDGVSMGASLKDLRDRLASSGVGLTDEEADDACLDRGEGSSSSFSSSRADVLKDLHAQLLRRECSLAEEGGGLTLRMERVEVLLQAEIGGEVRCLMELISSAPDGFQELDCLRPLRCALLEGEDWRQACQRLLQELFALEPAWQGRQLRLEEESCGPPVSARRARELPRLQRAELLHKVSRPPVSPNRVLNGVLNGAPRGAPHGFHRGRVGPA